jgi:hypothetical protein
LMLSCRLEAPPSGGCALRGNRNLWQWRDPAVMEHDLLVAVLSFLAPRELGPAKAVSCAWAAAAAAALPESFTRHWWVELAANLRWKRVEASSGVYGESRIASSACFRCMNLHFVRIGNTNLQPRSPVHSLTSPPVMHWRCVHQAAGGVVGGSGRPAPPGFFGECDARQFCAASQGGERVALRAVRVWLKPGHGQNPACNVCSVLTWQSADDAGTSSRQTGFQYKQASRHTSKPMRRWPGQTAFFLWRCTTACSPRRSSASTT